MRIPAFVHLEKTGGTSLINTLRQNYPFGHCDIIPRDQSRDLIEEDDLVRAEKVTLKLISLSGHSIRPWLDLGSFGEKLAFYTLLRNGTDRYISEYFHDSVRRGFSDGFEAWLDYEERWNFQTRALAGQMDLDAAKAILRERMSVVGILEDFPSFVKHVSTLFLPRPFNSSYEHLNRRGQKKGQVRGKAAPVEHIPEPLRRAAAQRNELDNALYAWARDELLPAQRARLAETLASPAFATSVEKHRIRFPALRRRLYTAYRNLVYKPCCGMWPSEVHMLPVNKTNVKARRKALGKHFPGEDAGNGG